MKYVDGFTIMGSDGNEVTHKAMVEHCKVYLDDVKVKEYPYTIKSEVTGFEFKVTSETKPDDWREFSFKCDMALD